MTEIKFTEWIDNQEDYGMCNPPMKAQQAIYFLFDYLDIPYDVMPESTEQTNTHIVFEILMKYSKKFRKEYKKWIKLKKEVE